MNHPNVAPNSRSDDSCSIQTVGSDYVDETPHCVQRDVSSPPIPLPKKIVSPQARARTSVVHKHESCTVSTIINGRREMSPSTGGSIDKEMMELHDFGILRHIPMLPMAAFDDIMDDHDGALHHENPDSASRTIYLQPRVPIYGCQIPPIAPSSFRQLLHDDDDDDARSQRNDMLLDGGGVPTWKDLGLLPMLFCPDDCQFSNNVNDSFSR